MYFSSVKFSTPFSVLSRKYFEEKYPELSTPASIYELPPEKQTAIQEDLKEYSKNHDLMKKCF